MTDSNTTPSLEDIAENLAQLLTNSVNIVDKYFDIFFNPTPMDVTLQQYNSSGSIVTYTIPNRAKDMSVASSGTVDPEGVVTAGLGKLYINTTTKNVFVKSTSSGNTGWINFTPEHTSIIRDTFSVTTATTSVTLSQNVTSKDLTLVFFNGDYMPYSTYSLSNSNTITFLSAFTESGTVEVRYFINLVLADSSVLTQAQAYANEAKDYRDQTIAQQISSITIGTVTTGDAGSSATVTNSGTAKNQVWDMSIPRGNTGAAATIDVGTVTTGSSGTPASVTNSGTTSAAVFDFVLPKGDTVVTASVGTTSTLLAGSDATVTNSGTNTELVLNFGIPKGADGAGVPTGGTTGQILRKKSATNNDTEWATEKISDLTDDTATNPIDKADTLTDLTATVSELNVLDGITATTTELNYCDGVTSNIQTQINKQALRQKSDDISGTTITLVDGTSIYNKTITENTTFTFDVSGLTIESGEAITFELFMTMSTAYTIQFPSSVTWIETPSFTDTGKYLLAFKTMDGGTTWLGNLETQWS